MTLGRALAQATAAETAVVAGLAGGLALFGGAWSPWLDGLNIVAPVWLALGLLGLALAFASMQPGWTRRMVAGLAAVGALSGAVRCGPELAGAMGAGGGSGAARAGDFRLVTHNVWKDNASPDATVATLLAQEADAVALQEVANFWGPQWRALATRYPYRSRCSNVRVFRAVLLSKTPFQDSGCKVLRSGARQTLGYAWARVRLTNGEEATLVSAHLAWPLPPGEQAGQWRVLASELKRFPQDRLILAGDFNSPPWTYAMGRHDAALKPLARRTRAVFSWPARVPRLQVAWPVPLLPIDHVYAGPGWRSARVAALPAAGSDHRPVVAVLRP